MKKSVDPEIEEWNRALELCTARNALHKLMRRVVKSAKIGRQKRLPDDDIELEIGGGTLSSCSKYEQVRFFPDDKEKHGYDELEIDNDAEVIKELVEEIKKRFEEFQEKRKKNPLEYIKAKKRFAMGIFGRELRVVKG